MRLDFILHSLAILQIDLFFFLLHLTMVISFSNTFV